MKKIKFNSNKGITLIALIITVIILLILAGTAISISINGGDLFGRSQNAVAQYNNRVAEEEDALYNVLEYMGITRPDTEIQNGNTQSTEVPDILKDYVLGAAVEGVRPGKSISSIYNSSTKKFINDESSIEFASTEVIFLNRLDNTTESIVYARYGDAAYKISTRTSDSLTTDVVKVYEPDINSKEGRIVQYSVDGKTAAKDWLVLYDNGTTIDIMSIAVMGSYKLGYMDPNATGIGLAGAMDSYENAVSRLNAYCGTLVTNTTAQKVRSVGTMFDMVDTTERYSSTFLENNPNAEDRGEYNELGLVGDMNAEQDVVRMSYYSATTPYTTYGYANATGNYWLASRHVYWFSNSERFVMRSVLSGDAGCVWYLWLVNGSKATANIGYTSGYSVRPVVRVAVGDVTGL